MWSSTPAFPLHWSSMTRKWLGLAFPSCSPTPQIGQCHVQKALATDRSARQARVDGSGARHQCPRLDCCPETAQAPRRHRSRAFQPRRSPQHHCRVLWSAGQQSRASLHTCELTFSEFEDELSRMMRMVKSNNFTQQTNVVDADKHMWGFVRYR